MFSFKLEKKDAPNPLTHTVYIYIYIYISINIYHRDVQPQIISLKKKSDRTYKHWIQLWSHMWPEFDGLVTFKNNTT